LRRLPCVPVTEIPMNGSELESRKRLLTFLLVAMFGAVLIYIGLTYIIQLPVPTNRDMESMRMFKSALMMVSVITFLVGMALERHQLSQKRGPGSVQTAVILSAALGETIAVYGLVWFFLMAEREWFFFGASMLYFVRLFMRLPDFHSLLEQSFKDM